MSYLSIANLIAQVLGGLALFLLGMKFMSDGLNKAAGEKLKRVLAVCTGNRIVATIAGTGVTCVTQSSSVTSVMTLGFVNAGLITLTQAIGLIFGANIGKTVTTQIVAFNVSWIALPAIALGFALTFITWRKMRGWGDGILGFGMIFFGMAVMSMHLKSLSVEPWFAEMLSMFDCTPTAGTFMVPFGPLIGAIMIGVLVTMVVQSSAATTAIVIALLLTKDVNGNAVLGMETAIALTLGSNIGTTITAQLASITANRVAKQTALAHTLFNVIGVVIFVILFYVPAGTKSLFLACVDWVSPGADDARRIANAHTLFNVVTTILLMPFVSTLAWICEKTWPISDKVRYQYLEPRLLDTPTLALDQVVRTLRKMIVKSAKLTKLCVNDIFIPMNPSDELLEKMRHRESKVDSYQTEIMNYLTDMMDRPMSSSDSARVPPLIHCTNDAERIGDSAENISDLALRMKETGHSFSPKAIEELTQMSVLLEKQILGLISALDEPAHANAYENTQTETQIRALATQVERTHSERMQRGDCHMDTGIIFLEFTAQAIAISRHVSNIYNRILRIVG